MIASPRRSIYLDYNATTPLKPEAKAAMIAALDEFGNPSSVHAKGRAARHYVEEARALLAQKLGTKPAQIVFTGSGTEANAAALYGIAAQSWFISAIEHDCVKAACPDAAIIPVTAQGLVDLEALDQSLLSADKPAMVAIMLVNNETGVIQPMGDIAAIVKKHKALLHVDAVQAFGKIPFSFERLGCDSLALSAHKIGGPKGVGALVLREGLPVTPLLSGGGQERRRRAGTENVPGIAGFGAAAALLKADLAAQAALAKARDGFEGFIAGRVPEARFPGQASPRVGGTSCVVMPGIGAETQLMHFDLAGLQVSSGSACSSGKVQSSAVLLAMGYDEKMARSALRISGGLGTLPEDYSEAARVWYDLWQSKRG